MEKRQFGEDGQRKNGILGALLGFAGDGEGVLAGEGGRRARGHGGRLGSGGEEEDKEEKTTR
jgi:hypothetical protein